MDLREDHQVEQCRITLCFHTGTHVHTRLTFFQQQDILECSAHFPKTHDNLIIPRCDCAKVVFCCAMQNFVFDQSKVSQDI